jgi:hypothetical protein
MMNLINILIIRLDEFILPISFAGAGTILKVMETVLVSHNNPTAVYPRNQLDKGMTVTANPQVLHNMNRSTISNFYKPKCKSHLLTQFLVELGSGQAHSLPTLA